MADAFGWSGPASFPERLAEKGLAIQTLHGYRLTVAGALHLLNEPHEKLGKAYIEVLRYREGAQNYDRARPDRIGPLRVQVERATQLIADELGDEVVVLGVHRHELPRLPRRVLREAVANAVAHRSYELRGTCYTNRDTSRCRDHYVTRLPARPVTGVENIRDQASARNANVIRVLRAFNLAEDSGDGVDVMEDVMREELLDPPIFADTGSAVRVTLPVRSAVAPSERAWVREVEQRGEIESTDRILLVHAARGEVLTNSRVRELLGIDEGSGADCFAAPSGRWISCAARKARRCRLRIGSLVGTAGRPTARSIRTRGLRCWIGSRKASCNAGIRERTGLDRAQTLDLLATLVQDGAP